MDETPELPIEPEVVPVVEAAEPPPPPQVTVKMLLRDAALDSLAALGSGVGLIILAAVVFGVIVAFTTGDFRAIQDFVVSPWGIAGLFLATQLPLLYFALRRKRRNREKRRPMTEFFAGAKGAAIRKGISAGLALTVLSILYSSTLQRLFGPDAVESQIEILKGVLDNKPALAVLILIIAVMAPVFEEVFFRGVVFGAARAAGLSKVGVAISATLFACAHVSLLLAPFYATFAVVMCWLYVRTGTLAAPIAAHMTLNAIACLALLYSGGDRV